MTTIGALSETSSTVARPTPSEKIRGLVSVDSSDVYDFVRVVTCEDENTHGFGESTVSHYD